MKVKCLKPLFSHSSYGLTLQLAGVLSAFVYPIEFLLNEFLPPFKFSSESPKTRFDQQRNGKMLFIQSITYEFQANFAKINNYALLAAAWIGAFPLKLDWLVAWKVYPVTSFYSLLFTNLLLNVLLLVCRCFHP